MNTAKRFVAAGDRRAGDETHRKKLLKVIGTYEQAVAPTKAGRFSDWQAARHVAAGVKNYVLANLPELLETFEARIRARGATVLWAQTDAEARAHLVDIARRHGVKLVVKSKSMTTEEVMCNEALEAEGAKVVESDLGEFIVQLAGEHPYHIVTPAMHKSKEEVSELFSAKLGSPKIDNAQGLAMEARKYLRSTYVRADMGITGANFLIAESGAVSVTENEGNARLSTACPPVHVVLAGIEKIIPKLSDLDLFLPLLAASGTGQQITAYNTLFFGPRRPDETDGPSAMYVILLDNGRSTLYGDETFREALRCIRCGACLNACPVYKTVGGHSYDTTYQGPIGSVITPHLRGLAAWQHLPFASSLCGACSSVCPVEIPLHHLLLENRRRSVETGAAGAGWPFVLKLWSWAFRRRSRVSMLRPLLVVFTRLVRPVLPRRLRAYVPALPARSFSQSWGRR